MTIKPKHALFPVPALMLAVLAGCTPNDISMGNAASQTMATQVNNPDPQYRTALPPVSGIKGVAAVDRYNSDQVKKPDSIRTTSSITGGGSKR